MIAPFVGAWFFVPNLRILLPYQFDISQKTVITNRCMLYMCMSANIIPSGKSILLLGIFMPLGL